MFRLSRFLPVMSAVLIAAAADLHAAETVIRVAPKNTKAYEVAKGLAEQPGHEAQRSLHRALKQAAEFLNTGGDVTVRVLVAAGEYDGKAGVGVWPIPQVNNPQGRLLLLGGFGEDFETRNPFRTPVYLKTSGGRSSAFIKFTRKSQIREIVISGFICDSAPSNKYGGEGGNLNRSGSRSYGLISFAQVATDHLVIADNVFMNAPNGVFDPVIKCMSNKTVIDITNNLFLNNVMTVTVGAGTTISGKVVSRINLRNNTFLLNWPYNPDPHSSNVGALMLNNSSSARALNFEGNLFAHNPGGAMQHDWPEDRMPALTLKGNLFFNNATLFDAEDDGAGVLVGKFGANPKYLLLDIEDIEDDFGYDVEGNASFDPGLEVKNLLEVAPPEDEEDEYEQDVQVSGFAPAMKFDPEKLPIPTTEEARSYGVQFDRSWSR